MPRPHASLAARAAVTATAAAAVAVAVVLPAVSAAPSVPPAPAPSAVAAPVAGPSAAADPAPTVPTVVAPVRTVAATRSAARSSAMEHALSKIGARYRWGAVGPNAFDCSGLVYWSYREAGTALPRTSRAMSRVGTPVARNDLRPGDLVFFYRPVSHVAIYVGDGQVVHASTSGRPVLISDIDRMPFTTARRV